MARMSPRQQPVTNLDEARRIREEALVDAERDARGRHPTSQSQPGAPPTATATPQHLAHSSWLGPNQDIFDISPPPATSPWLPSMLTEDTSYDSDQFYTATTVADEGTTQVNVTISRSVAYLLEVIVQSGRMPQIKVLQDAFRDAIAHWVHHRQGQLPAHIQAEVMETMQRHIYMSRMQARARARQEVEELLKATGEELESAKDRDDKEAWDAIMSDATSQVHAMRRADAVKMEELLAKHQRTPW